MHFQEFSSGFDLAQAGGCYRRLELIVPELSAIHQIPAGPSRTGCTRPASIMAGFLDYVVEWLPLLSGEFRFILVDVRGAILLS